jgi:hypothetical protein
VAEDPGIENEGRFPHATLHRAVHGIIARMDRITREYRSLRFAPCVAQAFVSPEMDAELGCRQRADGVALSVVQGIREAAAALGVDASALR